MDFLSKGRLSPSQKRGKLRYLFFGLLPTNLKKFTKRKISILLVFASATTVYVFSTSYLSPFCLPTHFSFSLIIFLFIFLFYIFFYFVFYLRKKKEEKRRKKDRRKKRKKKKKGTSFQKIKFVVRDGIVAVPCSSVR